MKRVFYILLSLMIIAGLAVVVSCGGSTATTTTTPPQTSPPTTGPGGSFEITIQGEAFSPATINVAAGTTVIWMNRDPVAHTVTSDTDVFASGTLSQGDSFSFIFTESGVYPYHCTIHPNMRGTVTVE